MTNIALNIGKMKLDVITRLRLDNYDLEQRVARKLWEPLYQQNMEIKLSINMWRVL